MISPVLEADKNIAEFVIGSHAGQFRGTGEPFYMHPLRMYESYTKSWGNDPVIRQAILLHDIVEDTSTRLYHIRKLFGETLAYIIDAVTGYDIYGNKLEKYVSIEKFIEYCQKDYRCLIVKLLDCIDNLETIHGLLPEKQERFRREKRNIYFPIFSNLVHTIPESHRSVYIEKLETMRLLLD